jgi:branched-subunit amino acid transport protein
MHLSFPEYLMLLLAMGGVTYLPRWLPLLLLTRRPLPDWLADWLALVPPAILSALLLPELVTAGVPRHLDLGRPELWAALPTLAFALWRRSLGGTVLVGMMSFWLMSRWLG